MSDYDIVEALQRIENELIASMMRNMGRHRKEENEENFQWSMWQAEQLKTLERYKRENQKKYQKEFKDINNQIRMLIKKAKETGEMHQEIAILKAIQKGFKVRANHPPLGAELLGEFFKLNDRKLEALIEATVNDMTKAETAMLRMSNDQYRKAIFNSQVYLNSGVGTLEQAVDMATKDFLARGLNCIEYSNGRRVSIDSYARMALKTANTRAYLQGESQKRDEWGINTVLVTRRNVACPKCLKWIAKVYYDDVYGKTPVTDNKYPRLSVAIAGGLYHAGCKDSHTTYFEGISEPPKPLTQAEINEANRIYSLEQQQRYNERNIRKYKRLRDGSLDPANKEKYGAKVKEWQKINREFVDRNGDVLRRDYKRESSHGMKERPQSELKNVAKVSERGIIKSDKDEFSKYIGRPLKETDNQHVREWYYANVTDIPNQIDKSATFEAQVKQAFTLRNKYKHEARAAMSDVETAEMLEKKRPSPTFESLLRSKMERKGLTKEEALEDILKTASKTNADVNKEFGL